MVKRIAAIATILSFAAMMISCIHWNTAEYYISSDGNDDNPGNKNAPFQSLEKARESVRLQLKEHPTKSVVVHMQGGIYYLDAPIVFTSEDSGQEKYPVVYKAIDGEEPVSTGSRELKNWQLLDNPKKLNILAPEVRGKIYVFDLKAAGINDFGDPTEIGKRPELFCNGEVQTLARWPNEGFVNAGLAKGETDLPETYIKKHGTMEGIFEYTGTRQDRWATEDDVRLGGYWYWDWSDEFQKVKKIDTLSGTIYLEQLYHKYGYKDSLRYFGLNLFSEIDQPGEWYLDRINGLLYWYPPEGTLPDQAKVTFSVFAAPFMIEMKNCSGVRQISNK